MEALDGTRFSNPYLSDGTETPYLPGVAGGAEIFGLLNVDAMTLLSSEVLAEASNSDAAIAMIRVDTGITGLIEDFPGFDLLVIANVDDAPVTNPQFARVI